MTDQLIRWRHTQISRLRHTRQIAHPKRSRQHSDNSFSVDKPRLFENRGRKGYTHTIVAPGIDYWKNTIEVKKETQVDRMKRV